MSNYVADSQAAVLRRKILGVKIRHARLKSGLSLKEVKPLACHPAWYRMWNLAGVTFPYLIWR